MKRASTHILVDLWAGGGHVIAGLLEPVGDSPGYFSTQPRRSTTTKRVSWSRVQCLSTPFDLRSLQLSTVHAGINRTVSCQTVLIRRHWMFIRLDIN